MVTKSGAPLQEVPLTVNVVPKTLLEEQGAATVEDVWRNVAGAHTAFGAGGGGNLTLRGFNMSGPGAAFSYPIYFNGLRGQPYGGFSVPRLWNVEQVEVLKGPASVLYGSGDPGGVINFVSRKPQREFAHEMDFSYGSDDLYRAHGHTTGPMTKNRDLLYLLDIGYENAGNFRDFVKTENLQITPALTWLASDRCRVDFEFGYINDRRDGQSDRGIPAIHNNYFVLPRSFNSNSPWDFTATTACYGEMRGRLAITEEIAVESGLRVFSSDNDQHFHFPGTLNTNTWILSRTYTDSWLDQTGVSSDTHLIWETGDGPVKNRLLGGAEVTFLKNENVTRSATKGVPGIYVWNPVYDTSPAGYVFGAPTLSNMEMWRVGGYAQDRLTLCQRLHLSAGTRYDTYELKQFDPTGVTAPYWDDGGAWTFNGGVLYDLIKESKSVLNDLSVYVSYGESYQPQSQPRYNPAAPAGVKAMTFQPLTGWQVETGWKGTWLENRLTTALALFHIEQHNVLVLDPTDPSGYTYATIGAQESEGLELEITGRLTRYWSVSANYAYTDAHITKDSTASNVGKQMPNVARNQAGLWTRVDFGRSGFSVMGGVTYVGERQPFTGFAGPPYPEYTTFDLGASYTCKNFTLRAMLNNVFDENIALGGRGSYGYMPGAPRNFLLTARLAF